MVTTDVGVTAGDLARCWPGGGPGPLVVDGETVADDTPLDRLGLTDGTAVTVGTAVRGDPTVSLVVVAGPLPPVAVALGDRVLVGRGTAADLRLDHPSVAAAHALVERRGEAWMVVPLDPAHPVLVDGRVVPGPTVVDDAVLGVGAVDLQVDRDDRARPGARVLHRPPRLPEPPPPDPGPPPAPPAGLPAPEPPGAVSLLAPVALGLVLGVAVHPSAGLLAAASPLLLLGAHVDARRRHRRRARRDAADHAEHVAEHRARQDQAEGEAARRDRDRFPGPVEARRRARTGTGLWAERPEPDDDPTVVRVAVGASDDDRRRPVVVALGPDAALGVVGPPAWAEAVRRALLVQAGTRYGPADLRIDGDPSGPDRPTRWLPHRHGAGAVVVTGTTPTIAIGPDLGALPTSCRAVVVHSEDGATLADRGDGRVGVPVRPFVAGPELAEAHGRSCARWSDPEVAGGDLPDLVDLRALPVGGGEDARRHLVGPLGVTAEGPVTVDLVAHGPHALVAGTTGAGKSELLRTLVTGLARAHPPTALAFVLVDYKGGSAFDACGRLPHVSGVVTDLDDGLGERLLVSLRAEVRHREQQLRAAGVGDLAELTGAGPPRLVVVVDEFATLAAELPDVLTALVDVARRGRSLGVHLVLATQRPAGVVTDDIRANTALRIALRTLDPADAVDVLGDPGPAGLPADRPGRALVRAGGGPPVTVQVATAVAARPPGLRVWREGEAPTAPAPPRSGWADLVDAVAARWAHLPAPAPVWLPPLPDDLVLPLGAAPDRHPHLDGPGRPSADDTGCAVLGLVDDPARRRQAPLRWRPHDGPLVLLGGRGTATTATLTTAVVDLARQCPPAALAVHLVHAGSDLAHLVDLPHVGACVDSRDQGAVRRLLDRLEAGTVEGPATTLLVVDGAQALVTGLDDLDGLRLLDRLTRSATGSDLAVALAADRPGSVPAGLLAGAATTIVLGLDDPTDLGLLGLGPRPGPAGPGRGRTLDDLDVQVGRVEPGTVAAAAAAWADPTDGRRHLADPLPTVVALASPDLGRRERDLAVVAAPLRPGLAFVVSGPPRSGRSTALARICHPVVDRPVVTHRAGDDPDRLRAAVAAWSAAPRPTLFAVDDADLVDDPDGTLAALVTRRHPAATIVVAVTASTWRQAYGTWLAALRPAACGLALAVEPGRDADCWTVTLPRLTGAEAIPGRGVLVDGDGAEVIQVAMGDHR